MIQVTNVLADEGLAVNDESDRVLEVRAQSENGAVGRKCGSSAGGVSSRSAQNRRTKSPHPGDGIVDAASDGAFADQKTVRDARELLQRVFVPVSDWLTGAIRTGHDENLGGARGKQ